MKTPDEIYNLLDKALDAAVKRGALILHGAFGDGDTTCCALSAYSRTQGGDDTLRACQSMLGVEQTNLWRIIDGFDGNDAPIDESAAFYEVGARLRAKYIKAD